ncbi:hypothetical protein [Protaetiibacter intestinalis]|uniref:Uncharacterized protein n=1 Tax=Protaetiibacter intestinalis TaxID=2419774 RepID=A0A387B486_9MICO|nr:hypothetical protein [Protaetiibacter intestinalis]AYF98402.1 hypothetical protein D7I47_09110 [Protaetiibacter intestinalis]
MPRPLLSLLVSLAATAVGLPLLWLGSALALDGVDLDDESSTAGLIGPALLALLGAVLLGAAGYAIRWSALGPIAVGGLLVAVSAVALAWAPSGASTPPLWQLVFALDAPAHALSTGLAMTLACGVTLLVGVALLVGGLVRLRPGEPRMPWRLLAIGGGLVATVATVWGLVTGVGVYTGYVVLREAYPPAVWQLAALAAALGVALVPLRASATGAWIAGVLVTGLGLLLIAPLPEILAALPGELALSVLTLGPTGFLAAVGLALLGLAAGSGSSRNSGRMVGELRRGSSS